MVGKLTTTFCLTVAVLLGSSGVSWSADLQKGLDAYERGDYATALKEWTPLAEQGDPAAQFLLGSMYGHGKGVLLSYETAVNWYTLAAEQGYAPAQTNLGLMYGKGQGVPQDYVRAHMWLNLSTSTGSERGPKGRDIAAGKMTPQQIAEAQKLAGECVKKNYKNC